MGDQRRTQEAHSKRNEKRDGSRVECRAHPVDRGANAESTHFDALRGASWLEGDSASRSTVIAGKRRAAMTPWPREFPRSDS